jgi:hypothetical protein
MNNRWLLELGFRGGHNYFWDLASSPDMTTPARKFRIAIADQSGPTPDQTDDGILYLDRTRPIQQSEPTEWGHGPFTATIPLVSPKGERTTTITDIQEAKAVAERFHLQII